MTLNIQHMTLHIQHIRNGEKLIYKWSFFELNCLENASSLERAGYTQETIPCNLNTEYGTFLDLMTKKGTLSQPSEYTFISDWHFKDASNADKFDTSDRTISILKGDVVRIWVNR